MLEDLSETEGKKVYFVVASDDEKTKWGRMATWFDSLSMFSSAITLSVEIFPPINNKYIIRIHSYFRVYLITSIVTSRSEYFIR